MLIDFTIRNFMSYRDEVSLSMVGQDIKVNSKVMKGMRSELLKQEAMLDKYKKGGKHLLLVFTSYSIIKLSLFIDVYLTSSKINTIENQYFIYYMVQI